jgi:hypothetical protein
MRKKSQAALEYLMTYGWAILVIVIVIAALYAMGVLTPRVIAPCNPCFEKRHFIYIIHNASSSTIFLKIKAGPSEIDLTQVATQYVTNWNCNPDPIPANEEALCYIWGLSLSSPYDVNISISYIYQGIGQTDTAELHGTF